MQETIYKNLRPTLLSNSLIVPTQKVREHVENLTAYEYTGLKQQVEGFYRTTDRQISSTSSSVIPVDTLHHLQTYTIDVNPSNNFLFFSYSIQEILD